MNTRLSVFSPLLGLLRMGNLLLGETPDTFLLAHHSTSPYHLMNQDFDFFGVKVGRVMR